MLKNEGKGNLVVLLLAERAQWECARSTRAIEDQPGHPFESGKKPLRPCLRNGASRRVGVGRVRRLVFLSILPTFRQYHPEYYHSSVSNKNRIFPHIASERNRV